MICTKINFVVYNKIDTVKVLFCNYVIAKKAVAKQFNVQQCDENTLMDDA